MSKDPETNKQVKGNQRSNLWWNVVGITRRWGWNGLKGCNQNCHFIWHSRPRRSSIQTRRQRMVQDCKCLTTTHWQIRSVALDSFLLVLNTYFERPRRGHKRRPTTFSLSLSLSSVVWIFTAGCVWRQGEGRYSGQRWPIRSRVRRFILRKPAGSCWRRAKDTARQTWCRGGWCCKACWHRQSQGSCKCQPLNWLQQVAFQPCRKVCRLFFSIVKMDVDQALEPPDQGDTEFEATWVCQPASLTQLAQIPALKTDLEKDCFRYLHVVLQDI